MRILIILLQLAFISAGANAQSVREINIKVLDSSKNPVEGVLIIIENKDSVGLTFVTTDLKGKAVLSFKNSNELFLKVTAPEFEVYRIPLSQNQNEYTVTLYNLTKSLPVIRVKGRKGPHIISKGDSLFYAVKDFESRADRTIGDVLSKIPGIEVKSDGSVSFKGKRIGSLYIDGDDLLGSRYGLATNNIQSSMVDSIQVIDNDQHIKVLQGVEEGKNPGINLVLKPKARMLRASVAEVKAGIPAQLAGKVTGMAFKPSFKTLNTLTGNNTGKDLNDEINLLTASYAKPWEESNNIENILSDNKVSSELPSSRWLLNKGIMGSVNTLIKIKPEQSLTVNAGYMYQQDEESFSEHTTYYLPEDTLKIFYSNKNLHSDAQFFASIKSNTNSKTKFINNDLQVMGNKAANTATLKDNNEVYEIGQKFSGIQISNRFSSIQLIRKKLITGISSVIEYDRNPEQADISPGALDFILNDDIPYFQSRQNVKYQKFYTSNSFGIRINNNQFLQKYNVGFSYLKQWLQTDLHLLDENSNSKSPGNKFNDKGGFQYFSPFIYSEWNAQSDRKTFSASLLTSLPFFKYNDDLLENILRQTKVQFTPAFSFRTKVGKENKFNMNATLDNMNNDIYSLYQGSVLKDYRSLTSQSLPLDNSVNKSIAARFDFQKSLKIFFANVGLRYSLDKRHWIYQTVLNENISVVEAIPFNNRSRRLSYFSGFSKYLFFLRTNLELAYNGSFSKRIQYQNEKIFPVDNIGNTFRGGIQKKFGKVAELFYKISYNQINSKFSIKKVLRNNSYSEWDHTLKINITPDKKWLINVEMENQKIKQNISNSFLFADVRIRYTFSKPGLDVNFGISNITGEKKYEKLVFTENILSNSIINLRPRTFYLSTYFNF